MVAAHQLKNISPQNYFLLNRELSNLTDILDTLVVIIIGSLRNISRIKVNQVVTKIDVHFSLQLGSHLCAKYLPQKDFRLNGKLSNLTHIS